MIIKPGWVEGWRNSGERVEALAAYEKKPAYRRRLDFVWSKEFDKALSKYSKRFEEVS